mgnify:CR=1 FL=1
MFAVKVLHGPFTVPDIDPFSSPNCTPHRAMRVLAREKSTAKSKRSNSLKSCGSDLFVCPSCFVARPPMVLRLWYQLRQVGGLMLPSNCVHARPAGQVRGHRSSCGWEHWGCVCHMPGALSQLHPVTIGSPGDDSHMRMCSVPRTASADPGSAVVHLSRAIAMGFVHWLQRQAACGSDHKRFML